MRNVHVSWQTQDMSYSTETKKAFAVSSLYRISHLQEWESVLHKEELLEGRMREHYIRCSKRVPSPQDRLNRSFSRESVDLSQEQGEALAPGYVSHSSSRRFWMWLTAA